MKGLVIKLGGSLFKKPDTKLVEWLHGLTSRLLPLKNYSFAFVVGGGSVSSKYVNLARSLGLSAYDQDLLGIDSARLNARLLGLLVGTPEVAKSIDIAREQLKEGYIPVMGGTVPGHTTNAVSALLAEALGYQLVSLTDVNGIYDSDPKKNPRAKLIRKMTHAQLVEMAAKYDTRKARAHFVFDLLAAKIAARSNIRVVIADGNDLDNLMSIVKGKKFVGTVIDG